MDLQRRLREYRVVLIVGARQVGKTTLARQIGRGRRGMVHHFDLEDPVDLERLRDPGLALRSLEGLIVLDEIQRSPELFPFLRVLVDRPRSRARFLILGSASPDLLRQSSETLAGRISYKEIDGFGLGEIERGRIDRLWVRGGFPRSFLASSNAQARRWRRNFVRSFLERDIPALGFSTSATSLQRFWTMVGHYHGQIWKGSEFARALGTSEPTVRRYLDLLTATFVVRQLQPYHANIKKRQVKAPKVYVRDSGILHTLLGIESRHGLDVHPKIGASWEGFMLEQVIRQLKAEPDECYFWATHGGAELDLLVVRGRKRLGFEFKRAEAPSRTRSMHSALADLRLKSLTVVHAGTKTFDLSSNIRAVAAPDLLDEVRPL